MGEKIVVVVVNNRLHLIQVYCTAFLVTIGTTYYTLVLVSKKSAPDSIELYDIICIHETLSTHLSSQ